MSEAAPEAGNGGRGGGGRRGPAWEKSRIKAWACDPRPVSPVTPSCRSSAARNSHPRLSERQPAALGVELGGVRPPGASLAAMAASGLRALGAKGPGWLRRGPWAPLAAGFCSRGPAGVGRPEPGPRLTSARQRDGIRSIVLNNPKRRNALSLAMLKSLQSDLLHEAESRDLKVIVISAEGPVFSSGHDLKELTAEQGPDYHAEVFRACSEVMMLIQNHPVPIIAMVNGLATAAGCQLVASCDIAVASDKSSFATPGVTIGLFCSTPGVAVGRALPRKVALEMLFTGEPMSAQEALLHGLLSRVVPEERLEEETMRIARKVASLSRPVLSLGKAAFYRQLAQDLRTAYHLASQTMVDNLGLPDAQEGIQAFLQKRDPVWSH
ncbi:enoyl-CoA hydratase domain-containing protein 3, mitochondrial [Phacochoerus africanus]|uniref:enoyl-CoA hydratase domain-containing protein 3, mitochondrial n=1 Tax=Phacochoerus africanus TaxID=41426 RepID=UPI001FDA4DD7|nr:enoyl-CoA hydratase domain-containing protein 3, mitochondrial [Phacochoerus africanus]